MIDLFAPVKGKVIKIEDINDAVFSEKMIGDGIGIMPEDEYICAPMDGVLESIFPTNHAFIVKNNNITVLVHIGLDTVSLGGLPFKRLATQGNVIKKGEPVVKVDYKQILKHDLDPTVLIIVSDMQTVSKTKKSIVDITDKIISL